VDPFVPVLRALNARRVRYVVIGVGAVNLWAHSGGVTFKTDDRDLFLPPDAANLVQAWAACEESGLDLWLTGEPLDRPRDIWLAERVVERRALTRGTGPNELLVDLTLVMKGFEFESVWKERRVFSVDSVDVPVARLLHIVTSKHASGRDKDKLFLATHKDALEQLLKKPDGT
jgi:hypothetical protein